MVVMMKMHSYFVYVARNFAPGTRSVPDDEHVTHATIVSTKEFLYFLVAPTMCFFRFYPRTERIRVSYLLKQAAQMTFCFSVMYIMCMQYLDPVFKQTATLDSDLKIAYLTLKISLPWFMIWLLGSYAFFHCWLNIVAELTTFADRLWYKDWWNADSFGSFWKLWNLPTHQWLLRYVYFQTIRYQLSKPVAVWATFFFSAIIHELCMGIVFRTIRYYFFLAMVVQVPFVLLSEKFKAKNPRLGNALMWLSLFTGQPLMLLMYFKVWYATEQALCSPDLYAL
jgi:diacylglycerol O-acyltransferase-1